MRFYLQKPLAAPRSHTRNYYIWHVIGGRKLANCVALANYYYYSPIWTYCLCQMFRNWWIRLKLPPLFGILMVSTIVKTRLSILYNFDWFVTHVTPWHGWQNFHFVTWLLRVWQGPDFVRCQTEAGYFSIVWLSLRCNIQRRHATEAKFTHLRTQCPNLGQNCHNEGCHIFWPFVRTHHDTVTVPIFWLVRYPLWRVTNESIEIVQ